MKLGSLEHTVATMIVDALETGHRVANARFVGADGEDASGALVACAPGQEQAHLTVSTSKAVDYLIGWRDYLRGDLSRSAEVIALDVAISTLMAWNDHARRQLGAVVVALGQKSCSTIVERYTVAMKDKTAKFCACCMAPVELCKKLEIVEVVVGASIGVSRTSKTAPDVFVAIAKANAKDRRKKREAEEAAAAAAATSPTAAGTEAVAA